MPTSTSSTVTLVLLLQSPTQTAPAIAGTNKTAASMEGRTKWTDIIAIPRWPKR